eukprot:COSAG01_NODE_3839_length_5646_cov_8.715934_2_plen_96_part_00
MGSPDIVSDQLHLTMLLLVFFDPGGQGHPPPTPVGLVQCTPSCDSANSVAPLPQFGTGLTFGGQASDVQPLVEQLTAPVAIVSYHSLYGGLALAS